MVNESMFDLSPADVMPRSVSRSDLQNSALRALPQSVEFQRAMTAYGRPPLVLPEHDNMVVTRRTLLDRFDVAMINRAPLAEPQQLFSTLRQSVLKRVPIILSPERPSPELGSLGAVPLLSPASVALLQIAPCSDTRRAGLHQKWRNRLNHATGHDLRVTRQNMPDNSEHWLFKADLIQQHQRQYRSWPVPLTLAYARENKGQAKLFQALQGKEILAAVLILRHGDSASYHISHTTALGKVLSAHNLLLWEAISWLAQKGCRQLDLGVINTEDAPGLARFKLGTGAKVSQLGGTWLFWPPMGRLLAPLARWDRRMMSATP
ncbi:putative protein involved in methicillin resistance [Phaeobacter sp. CECT 5382]|nr:putative protein involved in methicillin resistance [Phaeobacter sp. CECT 5382]